ncbi:hypothetical protein CC85DRAFT_283568 [Cutaneotrichosporon oleaginosum]|uniref:Uncharacterized protein n=1 Tax=Cutaneotrichosporon oleaginosum TaxID=879819 RepID=A0A0J0XTB4_9TREE|nr:uncharacterized protein CC85DRAFT_283568 [Cutaneotrichosporon oleaginosum]KLT44326.1 hypothetical protein CC85DRAFT_283568 [Cutaneotrichosporon oleaginosum]TXT07946.1 hypothetical protein COLE_04870 [Cutaneotrichosporon oleaginosum]
MASFDLQSCPLLDLVHACSCLHAESRQLPSMPASKSVTRRQSICLINDDVGLNHGFPSF